jgi:Uma2 family endonuclease
MPREAPVKTNLDFETFLEMEIQSQERHELVDGNLFVIPGGTERHNLIAGQLIARAFPAALEAGCRLLFNDVLVRTPDDTGYYPDVFVVCDAHDDHPRVKRSPCLIVEVLSESTEVVDRGEKLRRYRTIPTLESYVLLAQFEPRAEVYSRQSDGSWRYDVLEGDVSLMLAQIKFEVSLAALYEGLPEAS